MSKCRSVLDSCAGTNKAARHSHRTIGRLSSHKCYRRKRSLICRTKFSGVLWPASQHLHVRAIRLQHTRARQRNAEEQGQAAPNITGTAQLASQLDRLIWATRSKLQTRQSTASLPRYQLQHSTPNTPERSDTQASLTSVVFSFNPIGCQFPPDCLSTQPLPIANKTHESHRRRTSGRH